MFQCFNIFQHCNFEYGFKTKLSRDKSLHFKTGFKPKTWLRLRPFVNNVYGGYRVGDN